MDRKIFVVSDATGSTAEHVLKAALAQFEATDVLIERRPQTRTVEDIRKVVDEAQQTGAMLGAYSRFNRPPPGNLSSSHPAADSFGGSFGQCSFRSERFPRRTAGRGSRRPASLR